MKAPKGLEHLESTYIKLDLQMKDEKKRLNESKIIKIDDAKCLIKNDEN